jgi:hypothetical protein
MNLNTHSSFLHWQLLSKALATAEERILHPRVSRHLDIGMSYFEHVQIGWVLMERIRLEDRFGDQSHSCWWYPKGARKAGQAMDPASSERH